MTPKRTRTLRSLQARRLAALKDQLSNRYLSRPRARHAYRVATVVPEENVVGVAIAEKTIAGRRTGRPAITLLVQRKFSSSAIPEDHRLPIEIDGVEIDVREVGIIRPHQDTAVSLGPSTLVRPIVPGVSVGCGAPFMTAGTIGALVVRASNGRRAILGNCHVLAAEGRAPLETPIFQPGPPDRPADPQTLLGTLVRFQPLVPLPGTNQVDCAIAEIDDAVGGSPDIPQIGRPTRIDKANPAHEVEKFGRTTEFTIGRIISTNADITMLFETGDFRFTEQVLIESVDAQPFSSQGDSGALVVDRVTGAAVALVMAGSAGHTFANPLSAVAQALGVELA